MKALGMPEVVPRSLFCEVFGNLLARELGIETCPPALIELSPLFLTLINSQLRQDPAVTVRDIAVQPGVGSGSEYISGGLRGLEPYFTPAGDQFEQACRIFVFDLLVQNPDRRAGHKPNCATLGRRLIAYDFELCFSFLLPIIGGNKHKPWEVSYHGEGRKHLFYHLLHARQVDWKSTLSSLEQLSDARLAVLATTLPPDWKPWADAVCTHIATVRDHPGEFALELERCLA